MSGEFREFVSRNRAGLTLGLGLGLATGVGLSLGAASLSRSLRPPTFDLQRELAAVREEVAALRADVHELSSVASSRASRSRSPTRRLSPAKKGRVVAFVNESRSRLEAAAAALPSSSAQRRQGGVQPDVPEGWVRPTPLDEDDADDADEEDDFFDAEDDSTQVGAGRSLTDVYRQAEEWQKDPSPEKKLMAYELMRDILTQSGGEISDHEFLWRLSRATFFYAETFAKDPADAKRKALVFEAKMYAFAALEVEERDADVQKMCALTLGLTKDYLSISDSILMGFEYKKHITAALALRPSDGVLHHLSGRWCWAVAELSWWERKAAAALFATPPTSSYSEALREFIAAERGGEPWLVNKLYIAKCYLALGEEETAAPFLRAALRLAPLGADDREALAEAEALVKKHKFA